MELSELHAGELDLLGILESRVDSMVAEIRALREENAKLRKKAATGNSTALQAENSNLKLALAKEQQLKDKVSKRMEGILARTLGVAQGKQQDPH